MLSIEQSEYMQSFTMSVCGHGNRMSFFLPCLRNIRPQAEARGVKISYINLSSFLLFLQQCSSMFFLLIFFWIRCSFGTPTYSRPTKVPTLQHIFYGILAHFYAKLFLHQEPNLVEMSRKVFGPWAHLFFGF